MSGEKSPRGETEFKTHGEHSYARKKRSQNVCCRPSLSQVLRMNENRRSRKKHYELERLSCCHGVCTLWTVGLWAYRRVCRWLGFSWKSVMMGKYRVPWGPSGGASITVWWENRAMKVSQSDLWALRGMNRNWQIKWEENVVQVV